MKLPFFLNKAKKLDLYLGLFLKEEQGIALILVNNQGKFTIKEQEKFNYSNGWENLTDDIDEVLYRLEKKSGQNDSQLSKTIFFVYSHLVDEKTNDIKKPFLLKIKDLVKNLQLEALGYIECFEAVSSYLEKKEESPLTSVLLELDKHQLGLFVYRGGKISFKEIIGRTDNIVNDFIQAVGSLKGKMMLPSRIVLYDSGNIDDAAAKIISHHWGGEYFVQMPKIDILKEEEVIEGLINVFAGQIKSDTPDILPRKTEPEQSFGFVIGEDFKQEEQVQPALMPEPTFQKANFNFNGLLARFKKFNLPKINLSFIRGKVAVLFGAGIILISLFLNEYFFHKAQLTVYLPYQSISKTMESEVDFKTASVSANLSDEKPTTGKKEIGEKARGKVSIHNFDDSARTFSKGTELTSAGVKFLLDSEVKVASSSLAADGSAKLPGKISADITALELGPEGNLSKNQRFKFADLSESEYFAINDEALTGGSKREIRTVSEADQISLEKTIIEKAETETKPPSFSQDYEIVKILSETEIVDSNFSNEVGEESTVLKLTAKLDTIYYAYDNNELVDAIIKEVGGEIDKGYELNKENLEIRISDAEIKGNSLDLNYKVNGNAIQKFDKDSLMKKISGISKKRLDELLKSEFKITGYDISIKESLPLLKNILPFFNRNITLKISHL